MNLVHFKAKLNTSAKLCPPSQPSAFNWHQVIAACVSPAAAHYAKTSVGPLSKYIINNYYGSACSVLWAMDITCLVSNTPQSIQSLSSKIHENASLYFIYLFIYLFYSFGPRLCSASCSLLISSSVCGFLCVCALYGQAARVRACSETRGTCRIMDRGQES